ncbi:MAG: cysteine desulfurase CsdA, partial [Draconibacterium sp.]
MDYPIDTIREFFPVLNQQVNNRPLVYLDTAASALKPLPVLEAEKQLYHQYYGNVHRAAHYMADKATIQFEKTREKVKDFIHA